MISVELFGLDDAVESLKKTPTSLARTSLFDAVAQSFSARLRAATPLGYSGKLQESVVYEVGEQSAVVGYEPGVETAGDESFDSVTRPNTRGRAVLARNWVRPDDLEVILQETFDTYQGEFVSAVEAGVSDGIP